MAKGNRLGVMSGKLGNTVLYSVTNSNNGEKQGERSYRATIKNPKTLAQRSQRVKLTPAVNFYRAIASLLDHAFQSQSYGGRSHSFFMKKALSMADGFPFVPKGTTDPFPGRYLVSSGSIAPVVVTGINGFITTSLIVSDGVLSSTFGVFSQDLIKRNRQLKNGDQITFVWCEALSEIEGKKIGPSYVYHYSRIILDTASSAAIADVQQNDKVLFSIVSGRLAFRDLRQTMANVAAAVIVSRAPRLTGGAWQRSTAAMFVIDDLEAVTLSSSAAALALASYESGAIDVTSDWYLNQGQQEDGEVTYFTGGDGFYAIPDNSGSVVNSIVQLSRVGSVVQVATVVDEGATTDDEYFAYLFNSNTGTVSRDTTAKSVSSLRNTASLKASVLASMFSGTTFEVADPEPVGSAPDAASVFVLN